MGPPHRHHENMPHRLTKRHLPHDYHATSDSRGRRTLPLQWASPEGTFTWGEILPGAVALTYLWLEDAEAHTQAHGTHLEFSKISGCDFLLNFGTRSISRAFSACRGDRRDGDFLFYCFDFLCTCELTGCSTCES